MADILPLLEQLAVLEEDRIVFLRDRIAETSELKKRLTAARKSGAAKRQRVDDCDPAAFEAAHDALLAKKEAVINRLCAAREAAPKELQRVIDALLAPLPAKKPRQRSRASSSASDSRK